MNDLRTRFEQNLGWWILCLLLLGCLVVMWPFLSSLLWATVLSFSLWPLYGRLAKLLKGRRTLAAMLLCLGIVLLGLIPFTVVTVTLGDNVKELKGATQKLLEAGLPAPPAWLAKVPLVGSSASEKWAALAGDSAAVAEKAKSLIEPIAAWMLGMGLKMAMGVLYLALSILLTFFLLRNGPTLAATLNAIIGRVAGERGTHLLGVAGDTVRGVVYGVLGTALVQAVLAGIGLFISGVPGAALLAMLTFFLAIVPLGPPLILFPAAFWLFHQGSTGWGVFMLIWAVFVSTVDNFVKPWLISQGSDMPFVLILFGVLGGAVAFGFIGVFFGPTLLSVGYRLISEWSATIRGASPAVAGAAASGGAPSQTPKSQ